MADTRYLRKVGRVWYLRVPSPPPFWGISGEFIRSLHTRNLKIAQRLRDQYLLPAIQESDAVVALEFIAGAIQRGRRKARTALDALEEALGTSKRTDTLRGACNAFLAYLSRTGDYAPATIAQYRATHDTICQHLGDGRDPARITREDAIAVRDRLTCASSTAQRILTQARRLFGWLVQERRVARADNPFAGVSMARVLPRHKRAPSADEAAKLCDLPRPQSIDETTWRLMPLLARHTGCRAGELAQITAADVVTEQEILCLRITAHGEGKRLKTASAERLVPLAEAVRADVEDLAAKRTRGAMLRTGDYTAPDGLVKRAHLFLKHYNRRAKAVGADLSFHCWRVYANDAMASAGVDIVDRERILGHSSGRTQAAYTPENLARYKKAVDAIP